MAITFNRNEKCGEATFIQNIDGKEKLYKTVLYTGNCFLIMVYEYKDKETGDDMEQLNCFFIDDGHMERCLKDGIFTGNYDQLKEIRLNKAKCRNWKKIVELLTEYLDDIRIDIYKEGNYTWHEFKAPRKVISDTRMRELAESAISYLKDEGMISEFLEDRFIDLNDEEKSYFCIYEWDLP